MKSSALVLMAVAFLANEKPRDDKALIQGTWGIVAMEADGKEVKGEMFEAAKKGKMTFKGDSFMQSMMPERVLPFKLDASKKPATLDIEVKVPAEVTFRYLYEFVDEDTLRLCSGKQSDVRPTEFTSKGGQFLLTLKREGKKEK
jgi:uncharacterized protein (TIGR03067 family)